MRSLALQVYWNIRKSHCIHCNKELNFYRISLVLQHDFGVKLLYAIPFVQFGKGYSSTCHSVIPENIHTPHVESFLG